MIKNIIYASILALCTVTSAQAGDDPDSSLSPYDMVHQRKPTCEIFDDCKKETSYSDSFTTKPEGDTHELNNGFSNGQSGRASLSDTITDLLKPSGGQ